MINEVNVYVMDILWILCDVYVCLQVNIHQKVVYMVLGKNYIILLECEVP